MRFGSNCSIPAVEQAPLIKLLAANSKNWGEIWLKTVYFPGKCVKDKQDTASKEGLTRRGEAFGITPHRGIKSLGLPLWQLMSGQREKESALLSAFYIVLK